MISSKKKLINKKLLIDEEGKRKTVHQERGKLTIHLHVKCWLLEETCDLTFWKEIYETNVWVFMLFR